MLVVHNAATWWTCSWKVTNKSKLQQSISNLRLCKYKILIYFSLFWFGFFPRQLHQVAAIYKTTVTNFAFKKKWFYFLSFGKCYLFLVTSLRWFYNLRKLSSPNPWYYKKFIINMHLHVEFCFQVKRPSLLSDL